jgi:hypothetical protein
MSYNLFLDDIKNPKDVWKSTKCPDYAVYNWVVVRDFDAFIDVVSKNGLPTRVSFDHNLSIEHDDFDAKGKNFPYEEFKTATGYDCAIWLIEYCLDNDLKFPIWLVHAKKGNGKKNIEDVIEGFENFQKKKDLNKK